MPKRPTSIIFDWAGVFCTPGEPFSHPGLSSELGLTVDEMGEKTQEIQRAYYRGEISKTEFWKRIIIFFKLKSLTEKELSAAYLGSYRIYPEMLKLALNLKQRYKTALLSNMTLEMMSDITEKYGVKNIFHYTFFSNEVGLMKPDKEIFNLVLKELKSLPEETLFIDDSRTNVEAASKLGMQTILFTSPDKFPEQLKTLGIK